MAYFGTDGIRRRASFFDGRFLTAFSLGIRALPGCQTVAIGRDTRVGGDGIAATLGETLRFYGLHVVDFGVVTSPALAYCTSTIKADYGVMITASHNPPQDNGLKLFASTGEKAPREAEIILEKALADPPFYPHAPGPIDYYDGRQLYLDRAKRVFPSLRNKKLLFDCAYGASGAFTEALFTALGAEVTVLHSEPYGGKINVGCGATHPEIILPLSHGYEFAFSFDGDADRVIAAKSGLRLDGDYATYVLACDRQNKNRLNNAVCGTVMTNSVFQTAYTKRNITLYRSEVGDRELYREMKKYHVAVGGEQSGHVIVPDYLPTGDGLYTAALLAAAEEDVVMQAAAIKPYPVLSARIPLTEAEAARLRDNSDGSAVFFDGEIRCIVRVSGTEDVLRVYCEGEGVTEEVLKRTATRAKEVVCS